MTKTIALFIILVAGAVTHASAQATYTLTDSVAVAATSDYIRPADFLKKDIRWNLASSDLFTNWIDTGLYGFYGPQPDVFVDGLPVDADFFGWQNLNMLPISSPQEVTYSFDPQVKGPTFSPAGFLNFKSARLNRGLSGSASIYVGNETGDPGPYNYDSTKVTPNIDRWGPDGTVKLGYRRNRWYGKGLFVFRNHTPTDLAQNARLHFTSSLLGTNAPYVNHQIYTTTRSGLLETGYQAYNWDLKARSTYGVSKDYLFLQPFGREIPVQTSYRQLAFQGHYRTGDWTLTGQYVGHQKKMDKRIELHTYIFDWNQRRHTINASGAYRTDDLFVKPSVSFERLNTGAPGLDETDDLATFSVRATVPTGQKDSIKTHVSLDLNGHRTGKIIAISSPRTIGRRWSINPSITYTEVLPIRQHSFSYWVNRGYTFASALEIPYGDSSSVESNRLTDIKLKNTFRISSHFALDVIPEIISHESLNVPFQKVEAFEFVTDTQPGSFSITKEKGSLFKLYSKFSYTIHGVIRQSLALNYRYVVSGSDRYRHYFEQTPPTKLQYTVDVYPTSSLVVSLNALYRSSTEWNEFAAIEGNQYRLPNGIPIRDVTGTFHTTVPAFTDVSLSVQKWLWNHHLNTQFTVRNLLNDEIRMHPLGARLSTKFDIKISLAF